MNHVVLPRQTLWRIAQAYGKTVDELVRANSIDDPDELTAGRLLFIPGATAEIYVAPYPTPSEGAATGVLDPVWTWPVRRGEAISPFGAPRSSRRHRGLDIRGRPGQDVVAVRDGLVVFAGTMRGYGKTVIVDHEDGFRSLYGHNSRIVVSDGKRIRQGETIARVGRTGNASTDHCHLEIHRNGVAIDPLLYLARVTEGRR